MSLTPLLVLEGVSVTRSLPGGERLRALEDVCWTWNRGETWAFRGANGSGKSTLLRLIRGELWPDSSGGQRTYFFEGVPKTSPLSVKDRIALISPETQDWYLSSGWALSVRQVVSTGFFNELLPHRILTLEQEVRLLEVAQNLGVDGWLERDVRSLSNGQHRQVLLARALVGNPLALLLDEFFEGVDSDSSVRLRALMRDLSRRVPTVYTGHRDDGALEFASHELVLERGRVLRSCEVSRVGERGRAGVMGRRTGGEARKVPFSPRRPVGGPARETDSPDRRAGPEGAVLLKTWRSVQDVLKLGQDSGPAREVLKLGQDSAALSKTWGDGEKRHSVFAVREEGVFLERIPVTSMSTTPLVQLENVTVRRGAKTVLEDICWTFEAQQNWVLLGHNGAGKSTLAKVIRRELYPLQGGRVRHFGAEGGSSWKLWQRIPLVSSEGNVLHRVSASGLSASGKTLVASGFEGWMGYAPVLEPQQEAKVLEWMDYFEVSHLRERPANQMSAGELGRCLLARAMVNDPDLLILDEPFDYLDRVTKTKLTALISTLERTRFLLIAHRLEDIPGSATHLLRLEGGSVREQGELDLAKL